MLAPTLTSSRSRAQGSRTAIKIIMSSPDPLRWQTPKLVSPQEHRHAATGWGCHQALRGSVWYRTQFPENANPQWVSKERAVQSEVPRHVPFLIRSWFGGRAKVFVPHASSLWPTYHFGYSWDDQSLCLLPASHLVCSLHLFFPLAALGLSLKLQELTQPAQGSSEVPRVTVSRKSPLFS